MGHCLLEPFDLNLYLLFLNLLCRCLDESKNNDLDIIDALYTIFLDLFHLVLRLRMINDLP